MFVSRSRSLFSGGTTRGLPRAVSVIMVGALALAASAAGVSTASAAPATAKAVDYTSFVNPFVSTAEDDGNDMPGAQAPNGLAKVNPMTVPGRNHTGYDYKQTNIAGFTNTNIDGVGGSGAGGDVLVVPTSVAYTTRPNTGTYSHPFVHTDETATPGYYQVGLGSITGTDNAVTAGTGTINSEITAATRTGVHRYTFPSGAAPSLVFDLANNYTGRNASSITVTTLADGRLGLSGSFAGGFNGNNYTMYYYAETGQKATARTWADSPALTTDVVKSGIDTGSVITIDPTAGSTVDLRVTLSPISAEQAMADQGNEVGGKSFDTVRTETAATWNDRLGKVDVGASVTSDPDGTLKKLFYTHLYRMFATPVNATSTVGTYRGVDGAVHQADDFTYYDGWSSWDDFRKFSVIAYVDPTLYRSIIQSLVNLFADQAAAGTGSLNSLMHGVPTVRFERSSVIIADALSKGFTGFSRLDEAYPAIHNLVGYYTGQELRQGYITDRPGSSLERGYDQWALAIIADAIGKTDEAKTLRTQAALPFANVFKPGAWTAADGTKVGLLTPRNGAGDWTTIDYERFETANLYQGTPWQYNWYGAYDMAGTMKAMGGTDAARLALENMFGEQAPGDGSRMLHSNANEIDLQAPYLFNYVGEPSLTQKWARAIYTKETWNRYIATGSTGEVASGGGEFTPPIKTQVYKLDPKGFLPTMDNDAGTMSTMFVAAAVGLFPVTAGSSQYQVGSPFFDKTTIRYDDGRSFSVTADGVSADNFYIQSASLGGAEYKNSWVDYSDMLAGRTLAVKMGPKASSWGTDGKPSYSMSASAGNTGGSTGKTYPVTASQTTVNASAKGDIDTTIALTLGGGATLSGAVGSSILRSHQATISGLPESIVADITVTNPTTASVTLTGTITKNARFFVTFADAALGGGVSAGQLTGQGISDRTALTLTVSSADRLALQKLVDTAALVQPGNYSFASFSALSKALASAQAVLAKADSTSARLRAAAAVLQKAIDGLALNEGAYRVLQAEKTDEWSGGSLKNEAFQSAGDLGGVTTGSWVRYRQLDFTGKTPKILAIRYANQVAANAPASGVTLHAGDENGPVVGTATLPGTGGWGNYETTTATLSNTEALMSAKAITLVFDAPAGQEWVGNFDWFQFSTSETVTAPPVTSLVLEAENAVANSGGKLQPENSTWSDGTSVRDVGGTYDGAWFDFGTVDFGATAAGQMSVHYVNNSARCGTDSRVDLFLDSFDPANPGTPYATVPLAVTGADWTKAGTAKITMPKSIKGSHKVYVQIHSTTDGGHPYVANLDNFSFTPIVKTSQVIEAEAFTVKNGPELKIEQSTWSDGPVTNLGGTRDNDWLDYGDIDFDSTPLFGLSVHYVNNSNRGGLNSRVDLYLDGYDAANPGAPYTSVPLAPTGTDWAKSGTSAVTLPTSISGVHRVYLALHTTELDTNHRFVANIDNLTFTKGVDKAELNKAIADTAPLADQGDRFGSIDFAVFTRELKSARAMVASTTATQAAVDSQALSLRLAAGQLKPNARLQLEHLLVVANAVTNARYTDDSWAAFRLAITGAAGVAADLSATDAVLQSAVDSLTAALNGLAAKPVVVPVAPDAPTATVSASSVSVHWATPTDDGGSPVTGWIVTLSDGHSITIDDPTQLSVTFSWLKEAVAYTAQVSAINAVGASVPTAPTAPVTTTAPAADVVTLSSMTTPSTAAKYPSDSWPVTPTGDNYNVYLLRGFSTLPASVLGSNQRVADPSTLTAFNDVKAVEINNAATSAQMDRAQRDADNSPLATMTDALGSKLGPLFVEALNKGELPLTKEMIDGVAGGLGGADAAKPFFQYQRPFLRLGLASAGGRIYDSKNGGYDGLAGSGSFPSGHTFGAYTFGTTMATLLPELAPQLLARASEYGDNRVVLGFHYPLDVIGGRMVAQATVAHRWADPEYAARLSAAHAELESTLLEVCRDNELGETLLACSGDAYAGLSPAAATELYTQRLTYGFPRVAASGQTLITPTEASALLSTAFPELTDAQRAQVLQLTALDSGQPLDLTAQGDASWERINLAKALTASVTVNADGSVSIGNYTDATQQAVATAKAITVGGVAIDGFDAETRTYVVDWPAGKALPTVTAKPSVDGATVTAAAPSLRIADPLAAADAIDPRSQKVTVTSADGKATRTYTVAFWITAVVDPGTPGGPGTPGTGGNGAGGNGAGAGGGSGTGKPGTAASGSLAYTGAPDLSGAVLGALLTMLIGAALVIRRRRIAGRH